MLDPGQWATRCRCGQPGDFLFGEEYTVGQPGPVAQPTEILEIFQRPATVTVLAERSFVLGLGKMGVEPCPLAFGQGSRLAHDVPGDGKRGARCKRDADERTVPGIVVGVDHPFAVC